jgi:hypothetical protein
MNAAGRGCGIKFQGRARTRPGGTAARGCRARRPRSWWCLPSLPCSTLTPPCVLRLLLLSLRAVLPRPFISADRTALCPAASQRCGRPCTTSAPAGCSFPRHAPSTASIVQYNTTRVRSPPPAHRPLLPALLQISVPSLWQYVQETGGSRSLYGVAAAVDSFCGIIFLPLYGYLADRYSPKVRLPRGTRSQPANRHHNHQTPVTWWCAVVASLAFRACTLWLNRTLIVHRGACVSVRRRFSLSHSSSWPRVA